MNRRTFVKTAASLSAVGWASPLLTSAVNAADLDPTTVPPVDSLSPMLNGLLRDWCDALLRLQFTDAADAKTCGAFRCPACNFVHGRCGDAVYPLLHRAQETGQSRYLEAALRAAEWTVNVDSPDGAWTNDLDPKSWKGTTVFGAIAWAEALERHGSLIDQKIQDRWRARLKRAGDFIASTFTLQYGNINYGVSGAYGLALLGRLLGIESYRQRARELAKGSLAFFTPKDRFLHGEGRPLKEMHPRSAYAVDLGYNVEESLPSLIQYARLENDREVLEAAAASFKTHLEFLLPDGGWDNSWGTRNYKWTYWGSRTSDGCQPALVALARSEPVFAAAAQRNTQLLSACTKDGLLHGGPHHASSGLPACVHHTFCHAKAVAGALHELRSAGPLACTTPLPRQLATGVREFAEINTCLVAQGPWRATITAYDWLYHADVFHATGGTLALLWHEKLGPIFAGSLAKYTEVEAHNMEHQPLDFALTPRIECRSASGEWFTNLFDLNATISHSNNLDGVSVTARARVVSASQANPGSSAFHVQVKYQFTNDTVHILASPTGRAPTKWSLVLPVISAQPETIRRSDEKTVQMVKPAGTLVISANHPMRSASPASERVFNLVPGFEALALMIEAGTDDTVECDIKLSV